LTGICAAVVYEPIFDEAISRDHSWGLVPPLADLVVVVLPGAEPHDVGKLAISESICTGPDRRPTTNGRSCAGTRSSASSS
jgi:hypothetical protein